MSLVEQSALLLESSTELEVVDSDASEVVLGNDWDF